MPLSHWPEKSERRRATTELRWKRGDIHSSADSRIAWRSRAAGRSRREAEAVALGDTMGERVEAVPGVVRVSDPDGIRIELAAAN
jgi:hypothetical protein